MERAIIDSLLHCILYHRTKAEYARIEAARIPPDMMNSKAVLVSMAIAHEMVIQAIESTIALWASQEDKEN